MNPRSQWFQVLRSLGVVDWVAIAIFGILLCLNLVHIGFAFLTRNRVVVEMKFALPNASGLEGFKDGIQIAFRRNGSFAPRASADPVQEAMVRRIRAVMPDFRTPYPELGIRGQSLSFVFMARDDLALDSLYSATTRDLNLLMCERLKCGSEEQIAPIGMTVAPYPSVKPFDVLATLTLIGSLLVWLFAKNDAYSFPEFRRE